MRAWSIFYADGSVVHGAGEPEPSVPNYGVLAILQGVVIEHGFDHYIWRADMGAWVGTKGDASALLQLMHHARQIRACLAGESVTNERFGAVMAVVVQAQEQARDQSRNSAGIVPPSE